jgi:hypothetical protein
MSSRWKNPAFSGKDSRRPWSRKASSCLGHLVGGDLDELELAGVAGELAGLAGQLLAQLALQPAR